MRAVILGRPRRISGRILHIARKITSRAFGLVELAFALELLIT
jgi:hypothetical protein